MTTATLPSGFHQPARRAAKKAGPASTSLTAALVTAATALSVVVADRYLGELTDGHVVAAWLLMWAVVFAAFVATRTPARMLAARIKSNLDGYAASVAERRAERRFMDMAQSDPRIMAELHAALVRQEETVAFEAAMAPLGMDAPVQAKAVALSDFYPTSVYYRGRNIRLYYI